MSYLTEIMREQANVNDDKLSFILELDRATARETLKELKAAFPTNHPLGELARALLEAYPSQVDLDWHTIKDVDAAENMLDTQAEIALHGLRGAASRREFNAGPLPIQHHNAGVGAWPGLGG